jgi:uncharacterized short protein YbdD (DUF466 family)
MNKQDLNNLLSEMKKKWRVHPPKGTKEYFDYRRDIAKYNLMVKEVEKIEPELSCEEMEHIFTS